MAFSYPVYGSVSTVLTVTDIGVEPTPDPAPLSTPAAVRAGDMGSDPPPAPAPLSPPAAACQIVPCAETPTALRAPGGGLSAGVVTCRVSPRGTKNKPYHKGQAVVG